MRNDYYVLVPLTMIYYILERRERKREERKKDSREIKIKKVFFIDRKEVNIELIISIRFRRNAGEG